MSEEGEDMRGVNKYYMKKLSQLWVVSGNWGVAGHGSDHEYYGCNDGNTRQNSAA